MSDAAVPAPPVGAAPAATPLRRSVLTQQVYDALREGIIRGRYPQGSRLGENRLAVELAVSRVPLRETIPLLVVDGFVTTAPHRGAVVATWDERAVHELFDLRLCLEVGAARFAARRAGAGAGVPLLRAALEGARAAVASGDAYAIAAASTAFHEAVVESTGNSLMASTMRSVAGRMMWLFHLTSALDVGEALGGHVELCEAIASGDERVAEAVAYAHIERDRGPSFEALAGRPQ